MQVDYRLALLEYAINYLLPPLEVVVVAMIVFCSILVESLALVGVMYSPLEVMLGDLGGFAVLLFSALPLIVQWHSLLHRQILRMVTVLLDF